MIEYNAKQTKYQVPRGSIPDAENTNAVYLIKNVSEMRLTYQIKVLAYMAFRRNKKLHIRLPKNAKVHRVLRNFVSLANGLVKIERT